MWQEMVEKGARTEISVVVLFCHSAELSLPFIVVPTHIDGNEQMFFVTLHSVERKRIGDAAINEEAVPHFNGAEKGGDRYGGANGLEEAAVGEDYFSPAVVVGGYGAEGDGERFDGAVGDKLLDGVDDAVAFDNMVDTE